MQPSPAQMAALPMIAEVAAEIGSSQAPAVRHAWTGAGADTLRTSKSSDGNLSGRTSRRFNPMAMATKATAMGRPLPICP